MRVRQTYLHAALLLLRKILIVINSPIHSFLIRLMAYYSNAFSKITKKVKIPEEKNKYCITKSPFRQFYA